MPLNASHYISHGKRSPSDCSYRTMYTMAYTHDWQLWTLSVWPTALGKCVNENCIWAATKPNLRSAVTHHVHRLDGSHRIVCVKSMCGVCHMNMLCFRLSLSNTLMHNEFSLDEFLAGLFYWIFILTSLCLVPIQFDWVDVRFALQCRIQIFELLSHWLGTHTYTKNTAFTRVTQSLFHEHCL